MPHPRRRAAALLAGAVLLFVVGTSVQAGWLLVLAACLLGGSLAGWLLPWRMTTGIELEHRAPTEVFQGDDVRVTLAVRNASRRVALAVDVVDPFLEPTHAFLRRVAPGEVLLVTTARTAQRRGVHTASDVLVSSAAPFGVAERRRRIEVTTSAVVYPRVVPLGDLDFLDAAPTSERALHAAPRRGAGPDYLGIREYRTGDSMRHVHWPSTARHGELMVRELERQQTRRLAVVVDAIADAAVEQGLTPLDVVCSVAASVALAARAAGQGVRIVAAASGEPISLARADPTAILRWLAAVGPGAGLTAARLLDELGGAVLGTDTVVVILPTWRSNAGGELEDAIADLAGRVPNVVAAVVEVDRFPVDDRTPRLSADDSAELMRRLGRCGALVRPVGDGSDLRAGLGHGVAR